MDKIYILLDLLVIGMFVFYIYTVNQPKRMSCVADGVNHETCIITNLLGK